MNIFYKYFLLQLPRKIEDHAIILFNFLSNICIVFPYVGANLYFHQNFIKVLFIYFWSYCKLQNNSRLSIRHTVFQHQVFTSTHFFPIGVPNFVPPLSLPSWQAQPLLPIRHFGFQYYFTSCQHLLLQGVYFLPPLS